MRQQAEVSIGQVSRRTGCNIETIRYYERIGLLKEPRRSSGRYRLFGANEIGRLTFIRRARQLGFTLDQVRALLDLAETNSQSSCAKVRDLAKIHLTEVRTKIADLKAMESALAGTVRQCASGKHKGCPLIHSLSSPP